MCLLDFIEFKNIEKSNPLIGYREWKVGIEESSILLSAHQDYRWPFNIEEIKHEVSDKNSGVYAWNNNYYYNYNYDYNYNNNYSYNNNYYNNYYKYYNYYYNYSYKYNIGGIIHQYGRVAIHQEGQRSEFAKVITLFNIRKSNAEGPEEFLDWIDKFNIMINQLAINYNANVISWQDFLENRKNAQLP